MKLNEVIRIRRKQLDWEHFGERYDGREARQDLSASRNAWAHGEFKAATVLAGSVIEALLLDALIRTTSEDRQKAFEAWADRRRAANEQPPREPNIDVEKWHLHEFVAMARELELITPDTMRHADVARDYRNLIHPGRERRLRKRCGEDTALGALSAAIAVANDLKQHAEIGQDSGQG